MVKESDSSHRRIKFSIYIAVMAFTALIFILGLLAGNYIANQKSNELSLNQQKLILELNGLDLKRELVSQNTCNFRINDLLKERADIGANIEALEARFGKEDKDILLQKEIYELIELKTFFLLDEYNQKCNENYTSILFFYTNKENDPQGRWQASEDQGYILSALGRKYPNVNIFSFDVNIKNPAIDTLIELYKIEQVPALVINNSVYGYRILSELEGIVK